MYYLLPFYFHHLPGRELLVNEIGDYLFAPPGSAARIARKELNPDEELYQDLCAGGFISETPIPTLLDNYAVRLRTRKAFLGAGAALHIFVLTLRCNQNCNYCQASSRPEDAAGCDMSPFHLAAAIDLMFQSPAPALTMEFQGGESSLCPDLLEYACVQSENHPKRGARKLTRVLCTNCVALPDKLLDLCQRYDILISTSLDGPEDLHNRNRGKSNSYQQVITGIARARERLGREKVSALMTASTASLERPREIIDAYRRNGFSSIFLRPLNPYGLAADMAEWEEYCRGFLNFYRVALDYIIALNQGGEYFVEEFTALLLRKILTPWPIGFVDLQSPAALASGVVVYHYNGRVYASDESRMLAEKGDHTFCLGHVTDSYETLMLGRQVRRFVHHGMTEGIAGCGDCAFRSYCGADPVRNYARQHDLYGFRPTASFCRSHQAVFEHLFQMLAERTSEVMPIFKRWAVRSGI